MITPPGKVPSKFLMMTSTDLDLLGLSFSSPTSTCKLDLDVNCPASRTSICKSNESNSSRSMLRLVNRIPESSSRLKKSDCTPGNKKNLKGPALGAKSGSVAVSWVTMLKGKKYISFSYVVNDHKMVYCIFGD